MSQRESGIHQPRFYPADLQRGEMKQAFSIQVPPRLSLMSRMVAPLVCSSLLISCAVAQEESTMPTDPATSVNSASTPRPQSTRSRPRDGDVAIREEFALAVVNGEEGALRLFMRRHPDHPLADIARIILTRGILGLPEIRD